MFVYRSFAYRSAGELSSNMFKNLKLISLDVNNTLIKTSFDIGYKYLKTAINYGLEVRDPNVVNQLNQSFQYNRAKMFRKFPNFGYDAKMQTQDWFMRLVIQTFNDVGYIREADHKKLENTAKHLWGLYSRGFGWQVKQGTHELLADIRNKRANITLAVVSNFDERLETILRDLNLRHHFQHMFISKSVGLAKPDYRFFEYVLNTVNVKPQEYLHVGYEIANDYLPVVYLGANAILVGPKSDDPLFYKVNKNHVVPSLDSLREHLQL